MNLIDSYLKQASQALSKLDTGAVEEAAVICTDSISKGGTIYLCGNGGSAVDSQHLAGELVGRFRLDRKPFPAVAITANSAIITAVANDYDFTEVFARQVEALGRKGDVLVAISTSGNSENVLKAIRQAGLNGMATVGLTGKGGGTLKGMVDVCISAESEQTSHAQEALLAAGHAICHFVEKTLANE